MKPGAAVQIRAAGQLYAPLIALFALSLLATRAPGAGAGFIAGLAFALVLVLHALVFGAAAAKRAWPPLAAQALVAFGVCAALAGAGAQWRFAPVLAEAGVFAATAGAASLIIVVSFGRAPTLRDADW